MEISKTKVNKFALLRHKKYREKEGLFIVQGEKAVADTLGKFETEAILCLNPDNYNFLQSEQNIFSASQADLRKISSLENVPEIIAVYRIPERNTALKVDKGCYNLVLDGVQDPGNLGTIIRTAHWFGIRNIYCSPDTVDLYNPKVVMATMGSIAFVELTYCNLTDLFESNRDIPVYALILNGADIFKSNIKAPGFILMGSEGHGPSDESLKYLTRGLTIPPAISDNHPDSLNVAVATAITLSQLVK